MSFEPTPLIESAESTAPTLPALRLVLAEDSVLLREGLVRLFREAGYDTIAAYGDAEALLEALDDTRPELVVLDVRMPPTFRDEGVQAALEIRRRRPEIAILLLSQYVEVSYTRELLDAGNISARAGGLGYLLKDRVASLDELEDAVARVRSGGTVLDPEVVRELLARRVNPHDALTPREREVLALMAEGRGNAGIAGRLVVGVGAVEKHVTSIFQKLGLAPAASERAALEHRRVLAVLGYLQREHSSE